MLDRRLRRHATALASLVTSCAFPVCNSTSAGVGAVRQRTVSWSLVFLTAGRVHTPVALPLFAEGKVFTH